MTLRESREARLARHQTTAADMSTPMLRAALKDLSESRQLIEDKRAMFAEELHLRVIQEALMAYRLRAAS